MYSVIYQEGVNRMPIPQGKHFMDGVVILGQHEGSMVSRPANTRPLTVLGPVVTILRKHHNIDREIDRDSFRALGAHPTIVPDEHDLIIRVVSGHATLTIGGANTMMEYGDWGYIPRGVRWMVSGNRHFELYVAQLRPKSNP